MNSSDNLKNITKKKKKHSRILAKEGKYKEFLNIKPKSNFSNTNKYKLFTIYKQITQWHFSHQKLSLTINIYRTSFSISQLKVLGLEKKRLKVKLKLLPFPRAVRYRGSVTSFKRLLDIYPDLLSLNLSKIVLIRVKRKCHILFCVSVIKEHRCKVECQNKAKGQTLLRDAGYFKDLIIWLFLYLLLWTHWREDST